MVTVRYKGAGTRIFSQEELLQWDPDATGGIEVESGGTVEVSATLAGALIRDPRWEIADPADPDAEIVVASDDLHPIAQSMLEQE